MVSLFDMLSLLATLFVFVNGFQSIYDYNNAIGDDNNFIKMSDPNDFEISQSMNFFNDIVISGAAESLPNWPPSEIVFKHMKTKTEFKMANYCDPPNPCPIGFTDDNGCIDANFFQNTAEFNRNFQLQQDCTCDNEHMFLCPNE